jgi:hypothetical protein
LKKEHRLKVNVRNRVLRNIFELKREDVTGRRRLHNEELFMVCTPRQILFGLSKIGG